MFKAPRIRWIYGSEDLHQLMVSKALLYFLFLFVNLTLTYRVMLSSTFSHIIGVLELIYVVLLGLYMGYRLMVRVLAQNFKINSFEILLLLISVFPFISAVAAKIEFGQPLLFGLLAFKDFYLCYGALVLYGMLRRGEISWELVERAFLAVAWFNLLFFYGMSLFTNAAAHQDSLIAGSQAAKGGEVYYRFNMAFIFFGTIYYVVKASYRKSAYYLLLAGLFLIYIVFFRLDRTSIVVVLAAVVAFFFTATSYKMRVRTFFRIAVPGLLGLLLAYLVVPEVFEKYILMFSEAIQTVEGQAAATGQSWLRQHEMDLAIRYIDKHPFLGNGRLSNQWLEGGYSNFMGFFYPSDIGFMGQVFMYGWLGAVLLYSQFLFALYYILKTRGTRKNIFQVACKFYLLALFLDALTNGFLTTYTAQSLTVVMLVFFFYQKGEWLHHAQKRSKNEGPFLQAT